MKKNRLFFPLTALATTLVFLLGVVLWWFWASQPASQLQPASSEIFVIQRGESLTEVANRLEKKGLVRSSLAFKIFVLAKGLARNIQAGDFPLSPSMTPQEIVDVLTEGSLDVWLTFPEGWRREEFGRRLKANLIDFDDQEFLALTEDLEGYLFPDTYLIPKEASPAAVVKILTTNFAKKFTADLESARKAKGLTKKQVIVFASIVEREARKDEDRSLIAGILLKRWRKGWPLQADATVQYAIGNERCGWEVGSESGSEGEKCDWWSPVRKIDLEIDSPYNTYQYQGLPPSPICNPGLASIKAVLYPQESDYWFYLADPAGTVHYARTNQEHNENIEKYLR